MNWNKYTIKRNTEDIAIDADLGKKLLAAKLKRKWRIFNINQEKLKKWK